jgi:hypothetical protein
MQCAYIDGYGQNEINRGWWNKKVMAGLKTIKDVVDSELDGRSRNYIWRKTPSQATTAGIWFDLSMSPGMPVPKYWFDAAPLTARAITQSADGGFYHGANVSPSEKYLRSVTTQASAATALPMNAILCDYLLYYPTTDDGSTDEQLMDNTVTLPRYTDGKGVQILAVTVGARTGGQTFTVNYTNSDGISGRVTSAVTQNTATTLGSITGSNTAIINASNPFIGLQDDDEGVRSIESVTMQGVDVGLMSFILVKPLVQTCFREITVPYEKDFLVPTSDLIKIEDNAFLNFLVLPLGTLAATVLRGDLKVIWT